MSKLIGILNDIKIESIPISLKDSYLNRNFLKLESNNSVEYYNLEFDNSLDTYVERSKLIQQSGYIFFEPYYEKSDPNITLYVREPLKTVFATDREVHKIGKLFQDFIRKNDIDKDLRTSRFEIKLSPDDSTYPYIFLDRLYNVIYSEELSESFYEKNLNQHQKLLVKQLKLAHGASKSLYHVKKEYIGNNINCMFTSLGKNGMTIKIDMSINRRFLNSYLIKGREKYLKDDKNNNNIMKIFISTLDYIRDNCPRIYTDDNYIGEINCELIENYIMGTIDAKEVHSHIEFYNFINYIELEFEGYRMKYGLINEVDVHFEDPKPEKFDNEEEHTEETEIDQIKFMFFEFISNVESMIENGDNKDDILQSIRDYKDSFGINDRSYEDALRKTQNLTKDDSKSKSEKFNQCLSYLKEEFPDEFMNSVLNQNINVKIPDNYKKTIIYNNTYFAGLLLTLGYVDPEECYKIYDRKGDYRDMDNVYTKFHYKLNTCDSDKNIINSIDGTNVYFEYDDQSYLINVYYDPIINMDLSIEESIKILKNIKISHEKVDISKSKDIILHDKNIYNFTLNQFNSDINDLFTVLDESKKYVKSEFKDSDEFIDGILNNFNKTPIGQMDISPSDLTQNDLAILKRVKGMADLINFSTMLGNKFKKKLEEYHYITIKREPFDTPSQRINTKLISHNSTHYISTSHPGYSTVLRTEDDFQLTEYGYTATKDIEKFVWSSSEPDEIEELEMKEYISIRDDPKGIFYHMREAHKRSIKLGKKSEHKAKQELDILRKCYDSLVNTEKAKQNLGPIAVIEDDKVNFKASIVNIFKFMLNSNPLRDIEYPSIDIKDDDVILLQIVRPKLARHDIEIISRPFVTMKHVSMKYFFPITFEELNDDFKKRIY